MRGSIQSASLHNVNPLAGKKQRPPNPEARRPLPLSRSRGGRSGRNPPSVHSRRVEREDAAGDAGADRTRPQAYPGPVGDASPWSTKVCSTAPSAAARLFGRMGRRPIVSGPMRSLALAPLLLLNPGLQPGELYAPLRNRHYAAPSARQRRRQVNMGSPPGRRHWRLDRRVEVNPPLLRMEPASSAFGMKGFPRTTSVERRRVRRRQARQYGLVEFRSAVRAV